MDLEEGSGHWALAAAVLFAGLALVRFDLVMSVNYRTARVEAVQVGPVIRTHQKRSVIVQMGDRTRVLFTSDPLIPAPVGGLVCVAETQMLLRSFTRYSLEHSIFCPGLRRGWNREPDSIPGSALLAPGG